MEYYLAIKKNIFEFGSSEPFIQSEVSQKEKDKYSLHF